MSARSMFAATRAAVKGAPVETVVGSSVESTPVRPLGLPWQAFAETWKQLDYVAHRLPQKAREAGYEVIVDDWWGNHDDTIVVALVAVIGPDGRWGSAEVDTTMTPDEFAAVARAAATTPGPCCGGAGAQWIEDQIVEYRDFAERHKADSCGDWDTRTGARHWPHVESFMTLHMDELVLQKCGCVHEAMRRKA